VAGEDAYMDGLVLWIGFPTLMLKRDVEIGGDYAWQEQYAYPRDEYRKVTLVDFLPERGGRQVLVRDKVGEFETQLQRLVKPWSELGAKEKESDFRTSEERREHERRLAQERDPVGFEVEETWRGLEPFEPGKGGVPRVPEWLPRRLSGMATGVLSLETGQTGSLEDDLLACYQLLRRLADVCDRIRGVAREMLPAWEAEEKEGAYPRLMAENVRRWLDDGDLPFASSEIMPVHAGYGMSRSRASVEFNTGSTVTADFMERVADDYEELDRYASLALRLGWGFYRRWYRAHEAEMRRAASGSARRPARRR
jgi:hypothetical protein